MAARSKYDIQDGDPEEIFLGDDTYDRYGGSDLSGDPMLLEDRRPKQKRSRKHEKELLMIQQEREKLKAEILAELSADKNEATRQGSSPRTEDTSANEKDPSRVSGYLMSLLSGNILSRQEVRKVYPYLLFIAFLAFIYIGNVFRMQHLHRRHERLTVEVRELRAKSMTIASEKMKATRQSNIIREIERRGLPLKESLAPNKTIQR